jgi:hypothetical protein
LRRYRSVVVAVVDDDNIDAVAAVVSRTSVDIVSIVEYSDISGDSIGNDVRRRKEERSSIILVGWKFESRST